MAKAEHFQDAPKNEADRRHKLDLAIWQRKWAFSPEQEELYISHILEAFARTSDEFDGLDKQDVWKTLEDKFPGWHKEMRRISGVLSYMPNELLSFIIDLSKKFIEVRQEWQVSDHGS